MAKHGRLVNIPNWSKGAQKDPKWPTLMFLTIWDPFGPVWTLLDHSKAPPQNPTLSLWDNKLNLLQNNLACFGNIQNLVR